MARYDYEEAAHKGQERRRTRRRSSTTSRSSGASYRLDARERDRGREAAPSAKVAELEKTRLDAEKAQKELLRGEDAARRTSSEDHDPGFVSIVRNLPVLDLANPSLKVNQIMPANLSDDVIFTRHAQGGPLHDLPPGHRQEGLRERRRSPSRTHPNMELYLRGRTPSSKIGCTVCHQGRGRATELHGRRPHRRPRRSRRRPGASTPHTQGVRALAPLGPPHDGQGAHRGPVR